MSEFDVVLSSSHAVAKGALTHSNQLHISYIHTPMRYAWDMYFDYLRQNELERGLKSMLGKGTFMVLQVDQEKATKDGIRISVQLTEALTEGDYFERMAEKLAASSYSSFPLKHCLVFKVIDILPITFMQKK